MDSRLDDRYFEWLYSQVDAVRNRHPAREFWNLARKLHSTEFVWLVPNDDNRVEDGKDLRPKFISEQGVDGVDPTWMDLGCSVLEMLVALAQRAEFQTEDSPAEWFGIFLRNLGFEKYNDERWTKVIESRVGRRLEDLVYRNYKANGEGGLFPLKSPVEDQTKRELWYQLSEYIIENSMI